MSEYGYNVIVVAATGIPVKSYGPYERSEAVEILQNEVAKNGININTEKAKDAFSRGLYNFEDGGGVYLVLSEDYYEEEEE